MPAGNHNTARGQFTSVIQGQSESLAVTIDAQDSAAIDVGNRLLLKPSSVADEPIKRNRRGNIVTTGIAESIDRKSLSRIRDGGGRPWRSQEHSFRHVGAPKFHRLAEDSRVETLYRAQVCSSGQTVRPGS